MPNSEETTQQNNADSEVVNNIQPPSPSSEVQQNNIAPVEGSSDVSKKLDEVIKEIKTDRDLRDKEKKQEAKEEKELQDKEKKELELQEKQEQREAEEQKKVNAEKLKKEEDFYSDIRTLTRNTDSAFQQELTDLMIQRLDEQILVGKLQITFFTVIICLLLVKIFAGTFRKS